MADKASHKGKLKLEEVASNRKDKASHKLDMVMVGKASLRVKLKSAAVASSRKDNLKVNGAREVFNPKGNHNHK